MRKLFSIHSVFVIVLLLCVTSSTAVAWVLNATVAKQNAEDLAEGLTRTNIQRKKQLIFTALQDSMYFTASDSYWLRDAIQNQNRTFDFKYFRTEAFPRILARHFDHPECTLTVIGTSDDLMLCLLIDRSGPKPRWQYLFANYTMAPMFAEIIAPHPDETYTVLERKPPTAAPYHTSTRSWFADSTDTPNFVPLYYSSATSMPYLFAGVRFQERPGGRLVGIANGVSSAVFSEFLRGNLTEGRRLYMVERSARGAIIAASHGNTFIVSSVNALPLPPTQSSDPVVKGSAERLVENGTPWTAVQVGLYRNSIAGNHYYILTEVVDWKGLNFVLVEVIPYDEILGGVDRATKNTVIICSLLIVFDLVVVIFLAVLFTRPLARVHRNMVNLAHLNFADLIPTSQHRFTVVSQLSRFERAFFRLQNGIEAFSRYIPMDLLRHLLDSSGGLGLQLEKRHVSVMFCDLVHFNVVSDQQPPEAILQILTSYFDCVSDAVTRNFGTIDKYIGDCVMALWNAPQMTAEHERCAVLTILDIRESMLEFHATIHHLVTKPIDTRIGIHSDVVLAGSFGSSTRLAYTCLGAGVNMASRLLSLNSITGTFSLVSAQTAKHIDDIVCRYIGSAKLLGSAVVFQVYEPLCRVGGYKDEIESHSEGSVMMDVQPDYDHVRVFGDTFPREDVSNYADLFSQCVSMMESNMIPAALQTMRRIVANHMSHKDAAVPFLKQRLDDCAARAGVTGRTGSAGGITVSPRNGASRASTPAVQIVPTPSASSSSAAVAIPVSASSDPMIPGLIIQLNK